MERKAWKKYKPKDPKNLLLKTKNTQDVKPISLLFEEHYFWLPKTDSTVFNSPTATHKRP